MEMNLFFWSFGVFDHLQAFRTIEDQFRKDKSIKKHLIVMLLVDFVHKKGSLEILYRRNLSFPVSCSFLFFHMYPLNNSISISARNQIGLS